MFRTTTLARVTQCINQQEFASYNRCRSAMLFCIIASFQ